MRKTLRLKGKLAGSILLLAVLSGCGQADTPETESSTASVIEVEIETEAETESRAEEGVKPEPGSEAEPKADAGAEPEPGSETEPKSEEGAKPESDTGAETKSNDGSEAETDAGTETAPKDRAEAGTGTTAGISVESKAEAQGATAEAVGEGSLVAALAGKWCLAVEKTEENLKEYDNLQNMWGTGIHYGNEMEIGSDGSFRFYIGINYGGGGTAAEENGCLMADTEPYAPEEGGGSPAQFEIVPVTEDGIQYLTTGCWGETLYWERKS